MLTSTGCSYSFDNRPGGGANLIPDKNGNCHPYKNPYEEMVKWAPYQSILSKLVKRYTGKSVDVVLKENIEQNVRISIDEHKFNIINEHLNIAISNSTHEKFIENILSKVDNMIPAFFFIDPFKFTVPFELNKGLL